MRIRSFLLLATLCALASSVLAQSIPPTTLAFGFTGGASTQAATPTFSPAGGTYGSTQTVTISDATPSSTIYYTEDGSTPTTGSPVYSTALSISSTTTVKAIATAAGYTQSSVGTAVYTISGGSGVPTNLQVILQGQSGPNVFAFYNSGWGGPPSTLSNLSPNLQYIGWHSVSGATSYNIYDCGAGAALASCTLVANRSAAQVATDYSTYTGILSSGTCYQNQQTSITCLAPPGIDSAYLDTTATQVVGGCPGYPTCGSGLVGPVIKLTGSINIANPHTLTISGVGTNSFIAGQNVNSSAGLNNNACVVASTSGSLPTLTVNFTAVCTSAAETNQTIYVSGNGYFNGTATWSSGASSMVVSAIQAQAFVAGQGVGGPGIPVGTTIPAFGATCDGASSTGTGGAGTYCLDTAATSSETSQTYGTVYLSSKPHLMRVTAVVGGVESAAGTAPNGVDTYPIIPFVTNGQLECSGGVFSSGTLTLGNSALSTTPLGYSQAADWVSTSLAYTNTFSGNYCASYNIGTAGYNYINFAVYAPSAGSLSVEPEIAGDGELALFTFASQGYTCTPSCSGAGNVPSGHWVTFKIPMGGSNGIYLDNSAANGGLLSQSLVPQTAFYKNTWSWAPYVSQTSQVEIWFSVD